jgi:cell division transport system permease protein
MTGLDMRGFNFALREGFRNFLRNRTLSLAMAGSVAVAVFALGAVVLAAINVNFALKEWESKVELVAFLRHEVGEEQARGILGRIRTLPQVEDARLVSGQESWLKLFAETGQPLDLGRVSLDEILPPTVVIKLKPGANEIPKIKELSAQIGGFEGVDEVKFEQALLERYLQFRRQMTAAATAINIIWLLIFAIIMANISRLAWAARSGEIRSMRMMGASAGLMRKIFSIESLLQGAAGSLAGTAILYCVAFIIAQKLGRPVRAPAL